MTAGVKRPEAGVRGFLERGGLVAWLVVVAVYFVLYLGAGWVVSRLASDLADDDLLSSAGSVFVQLGAALIAGAIILVLFSSVMGWTRELFARQPVYRSWWMWLGPGVALVPVITRVLGIDWGRHAVDVLATVFLTGALIGFVEELMFRGIGVKMLRDGGHGEFAVAALTSLLFAFSHSVNLFRGQALSTVAFTWVYTFSFGVCMYLTLRATGFLVGAMVLHALTDPTTILATGGIDEITDTASDSAFMDVTAVFTILLILLGVVLLAFVRGQAARGPVAPAHQP
jgi:membrane protease YdiL (CAAX protease family)